MDHLIPPDESVPLKGSRFADFEDQVEALGRAVLPVALEHFPFLRSGFTALERPRRAEKSRGLKPAARNTKRRNALEERAALEGDAEVTHPGCCPFCGSARVYLKRKVTQPELLSPQGEVVIRKQHARCRSCGSSFSSSGSRLGVAR